jgi:hypothetical protein
VHTLSITRACVCSLLCVSFFLHERKFCIDKSFLVKFPFCFLFKAVLKKEGGHAVGRLG